MFLAPAEVSFVSRKGAPAGCTVAVWGSKTSADALPHVNAIWRLEDGFLRSVGLGADLVTPLSWVVDRVGIYYDATAPSELEHLLATRRFTRGDRDRGTALRERIVSAGLTKYNVGTATWQRSPAAQRVILIPGQVETDASIRLGTNGVRTNLALAQRVRRSEPDAFLVYKPHPDVTAGLRRRGADENEVARWVDQVVTDCSVQTLFAGIDEIHTMTSLAGFEGLMRGKKVVTYGTPFYAGWGLTTDRDMVVSAVERRKRRLQRDELVCAALALYPRYASRNGSPLPGPEHALDELTSWRASRPPLSPVWRPLLRLLRH